MSAYEIVKISRWCVCLETVYLVETEIFIESVGKSGFVSHTKHIAEATNMDLFHSWLITYTVWFSEFENKIAYLGAVKFKIKD